jgi:uridine phosphorylase
MSPAASSPDGGGDSSAGGGPGGGGPGGGWRPAGVEPAEFPILEFDPDPVALIEPSALYGSGRDNSVEMPQRAVGCFFGDVVDHVADQHNARLVVDLTSEHGRHSVWELEVDGQRIAFFQPGVGAPLAAFFFEEMIAYGVRAAIACGGAGVLVPEMQMGHTVVVTAALRDEGTSYHYLPPSRRVEADTEVVLKLTDLLEQEGLPYSAGLTWTTDAPYRETQQLVAARRSEGCLTVEMEAAALIAVAKWRGIRFGHLLYAADSLGGIEWEHRGWTTASEVRERLFWLAVRACLAL